MLYEIKAVSNNIVTTVVCLHFYLGISMNMSYWSEFLQMIHNTMKLITLHKKFNDVFVSSKLVGKSYRFLHAEHKYVLESFSHVRFLRKLQSHINIAMSPET